MSDDFADGVPVLITTADGLRLSAVARSGLERERDRAGRKIHDFPVVWVEVPRWDGSGTVLDPWPADAVETAPEETARVR